MAAMLRDADARFLTRLQDGLGFGIAGCELREEQFKRRDVLPVLVDLDEHRCLGRDVFGLHDDAGNMLHLGVELRGLKPVLAIGNVIGTVRLRHDDEGAEGSPRECAQDRVDPRVVKRALV
jgi:hypothetical protein